jgi:hypothetical protein
MYHHLQKYTNSSSPQPWHDFMMMPGKELNENMSSKQMLFHCLAWFYTLRLKLLFCTEVFSGDKLHQYRVTVLYFGDCLCLHQGLKRKVTEPCHLYSLIISIYYVENHGKWFAVEQFSPHPHHAVFLAVNVWSCMSMYFCEWVWLSAPLSCWHQFCDLKFCCSHTLTYMILSIWITVVQSPCSLIL